MVAPAAFATMQKAYNNRYGLYTLFELEIESIQPDLQMPKREHGNMIVLNSEGIYMRDRSSCDAFWLSIADSACLIPWSFDFMNQII